jgi:tetratricopeptide (TPR) repeat protein
MKKTAILLSSLIIAGCGPTTGGGGSKPGKISGIDKSAPEKSVSVQPLPVVNAGDMSSRVSVTGMADRLKSSQRAVQSNPQNFGAYVEMGDIYSKMGRDAAAADAYENALLVKPKQVDVQLKLAESLGNSGKANQSLEIYKQLSTIHESPWEVKNDMANVYRKKKDFINATKLCQEILIQQKNNIDAINTLALTYYDQQKYELAALTLQKAIKAKVNNAVTHNNLGLAYAKMDLDTESVTELKKAAQMDEKFEEPRMNLAQLNMENGNYAEASQLYYEVLRANNANLVARQNLGVALMSSKNTEEAEKIFLSMLQLDPFNADSAYHLGTLYHLYMQDGEKAVEYYQRFVAMSKPAVAQSHPVFNSIAQAKKLPPKNPPPAPAAPALQNQDAGKNVKVPAKKAVEPTKKGAPANVKKKK